MSADVIHAAGQEPAKGSTLEYDRFEDASEEIRLVEIVHHTDQCLKLKLRKFKIANAPEYNAISYTWGDAGVTVEIIVNDQTKHITRNCRFALEQVHWHSHLNQPHPVYFWIDSICINQDDDEEKKHQVAMMSRIYTQAVKVLACIGDHQDNSEDLATTLAAARDFAEQCKNGQYFSNAEKSWSRINDKTTLGAVKSFICNTLERKDGGELLMRRFLDTFYDFSARQYWTRLWIIQEVAASKHLEVLCGFDKFSRPDIFLLDWIATSYRWSFYVRINAPRGSFYNSNMTSFDRDDAFSFLTFVLNRNSKDRIPAIDIFSSRIQFGCSRPEDRVYGMLDLVEWPNVEPSIKLEPVYGPCANMDVAEYFLSYVDYTYRQYPPIFKGLEISHDLSKMETLIKDRSVELPTPQATPGKYSTRMYDLDINSCEILSRKNMDRLTAELVRIKTTTRDFHPTTDMINNAPQLLYSESDIAGLLCSKARENDLIVKTPFSKGLLVLRETGNSNEYDIIGQGLLLAGFDFPETRLLLVETRERYANELINHYIRLMWIQADLGTGASDRYEFRRENLYRERFAGCLDVLQKYYGVRLESSVHEEEPQPSMISEEISSSTIGFGDDLFEQPHPEKRGQHVLSQIRSLLRRFEEIQRIAKQDKQSLDQQGRKIGWRQTFILKLEPLEMLLLACQDLEKDGTRNEDKMMGRLKTKVYGTVIAED
ncbi:hypothetical protein PFICI_11069 [Pestalotiopsis fici W106-1]|uniref:Heterokaryon incompatibility domain-containing protein n=1 Tax=Pestalotiopsis fici (strain W106-1 / CGMCC3.15140) TaxID=1229662 RepID=W3WTM8_PESFW|nr:uncharacterized protein PFICI_11069 [Pestalotiopsis fici W106-1]ETS77195.1 hypothetical protein PFICI_11069 [Pestalotiopsis fici W106-1]